jgi:cytidyltransferase-like protein
MKTVMVAGKFDPLHEGHIDHIRKAAKLGKLLVITHTDEVIKKLKGRCNIPLR